MIFLHQIQLEPESELERQSEKIINSESLLRRIRPIAIEIAQSSALKMLTLSGKWIDLTVLETTADATVTSFRTISVNLIEAIVVNN